MPTIHAVLLLTLGGVWGADPRDAQYQDRPAADDPFATPADYRPGVPRQPQAVANDNSPATVQLPSPPLPTDEPPINQLDYATAGQETGAGAETEPYVPATGQWVGANNDTAQPEAVYQQQMTPPQVAPQQMPVSAPGQRLPVQPMPLSPPAGNAELLPQMMPTVAWPVVIGSLSAVIGLFLIVAWVFKRGAPRAGGLLPREVVEVLGRSPLAEHKQMQLLRLGNKLVLIAVSQTGTDTLAEITDPVEVDRLTGFCYQRHPHSSTMAFHQVFKSLETTPQRKAKRGTQRVGFPDLDRLSFDDSAAESDHVH